MRRSALFPLLMISAIILTGCPILDQFLYESYEITYIDTMADSGSPPIAEEFEPGAAVTVAGPGTLERVGHSFVGWSTESNGAGETYAPGASIVMPAADLALYAQWRIDTHVVAFEPNGATNGAPPPQIVAEYGASVTIPSAGSLILTGWEFVEWNVSVTGDGAGYAPGSLLTVPAEDVTLFARWYEIPVFNVIYHANGGTGTVPVDGFDYASGATLTVAAADSLFLTGHTFAGWNTDATGLEIGFAAGDTTEMSAVDLVLFAQWSVNSYTVEYCANGADSGTVPPEQTHDFGAAVSVADAGSLSLTGNTFVGWNSDPGGAGSPFSPGSSFVMPAEDMRLYAQWTQNPTFTVTYDGNGSNLGMPPVDTNEYQAGAAVSVAEPGSMGWVGYRFVEWNTSSDGSGESLAPGSELEIPEANLTLFAVWEIDSFSFSYDPNGADTGVSPSSSECAFGAEVIVSGPGTLARAGHTFAGWNTESNGEGTDYSEGSSLIMPAAPLTLFAQWAIDSYTLAYEAADADGGSVPEGGRFEYGSEVTVEGAGSLTRTGYTFTGWNTDEAGDGTDYAVGSLLTIPTGGVTLYAQWSANSYSVSYEATNADDGAPPSGGTYSFNSTLQIAGPGTLTRVGHSFAAWDTESGGDGDRFLPGDDYIIPATATVLYAQWTIDNYTLVYDENGADAGTPPPAASYAYGTEVVVADPGDIGLTGFAFENWNTESGGTGDIYLPGETIIIGAGNTTLYAIWSPAPWASVPSAGELPVEYRSVATGSDGAVYVAGIQRGSDVFDYGSGVTAAGPWSGYNAVLIRYSELGNAEWATVPSSGSDDTEFHSVATDGGGNIYVAGTFEGTGSIEFGNGVSVAGSTTGKNCLLIKYTSTGTAVWAKTVAGGSLHSHFNGVATDAAGNVFAAGHFAGAHLFTFGEGVTAQSPNSWDSALIVKYDSEGTALWARTIVAGPATTKYFDVATDAIGNAYVAGMQGTLTAEFVYTYDAGVTAASSALTDQIHGVVVKYDSDGSALWARSESNSDFGDAGSTFNAIAATALGDVCAVGYQKNSGTSYYGSGVSTAGTGGSENAVAVKYNSTGSAQWARVLRCTVDPDNFNQRSTYNGVDFDVDGNIYVAGFHRGTMEMDYGSGVSIVGGAEQYNGSVVSFNPNGLTRWVVASTTGYNSEFMSVVVDGSACVLAAGEQLGTGSYTYSNGLTVTPSPELPSPYGVLVKLIQ